MKRPLASWICLGAHFERPGALPGRPGRGRGEVRRGPGEALETSWKPVGAPKTVWPAKGGLPGAYGALLEASWGALGGLSELSWTVLEASWGPKGCPQEAQEGPKSSPRGDWSSNLQKTLFFNLF